MSRALDADIANRQKREVSGASISRVHDHCSVPKEFPLRRETTDDVQVVRCSIVIGCPYKKWPGLLHDDHFEARGNAAKM